MKHLDARHASEESKKQAEKASTHNKRRLAVGGVAAGITAIAAGMFAGYSIHDQTLANARNNDPKIQVARIDEALARGPVDDETETVTIEMTKNGLGVSVDDAIAKSALRQEVEIDPDMQEEATNEMMRSSNGVTHAGEIVMFPADITNDGKPDVILAQSVDKKAS